MSSGNEEGQSLPVEDGFAEESYDVCYAECGCPAGMGPHSSCKHIASLANALVDFCKLKSLPDNLTCTDRSQQRNQPRGRHIPPIPVEKLGSRW